MIDIETIRKALSACLNVPEDEVPVALLCTTHNMVLATTELTLQEVSSAMSNAHAAAIGFAIKAPNAAMRAADGVDLCKKEVARMLGEAQVATATATLGQREFLGLELDG